MRLTSSLVWAAVLALGCADDPAASARGGDAGATGAGGDSGSGSRCTPTFDGAEAPQFEQPPGIVRVFGASDFVVVDAVFLDAPRREVHEESARSGACRLLTYDSPSFCDPECENPELCVHGKCERFPEPVSAGALAVALGEEHRVEVQPTTLARYYWGTEEFGSDEVSWVAVSAPGDVAPSFELEACLSPAPEPTLDWAELMRLRAPGADVELAWSNPVSTARVYLRMTTCIGTHGGISPVEIECEGRDAGKLTLPGAYLDALYEQGWGRGECGGNDVIRYHGSDSGDDAVRLRAESQRSFWFQPDRAAP